MTFSCANKRSAWIALPHCRRGHGPLHTCAAPPRWPRLLPRHAAGGATAPAARTFSPPRCPRWRAAAATGSGSGAVGAGQNGQAFLAWRALPAFLCQQHLQKANIRHCHRVSCRRRQRHHCCRTGCRAVDCSVAAEHGVIGGVFKCNLLIGWIVGSSHCREENIRVREGGWLAA